MRILNKHNLPEPFVRAARAYMAGPPVEGRIRVTSLIGPPQIRTLLMRHYDEITEDASDRVWAILGTACHAVLEHHDAEQMLSEERLEMVVDGMTISGQVDLYDGETELITDWKTTSAFTVKK